MLTTAVFEAAADSPLPTPCLATRMFCMPSVLLAPLRVELRVHPSLKTRQPQLSAPPCCARMRALGTHQARRFAACRRAHGPRVVHLHQLSLRFSRQLKRVDAVVLRDPTVKPHSKAIPVSGHEALREPRCHAISDALRGWKTGLGLSCQAHGLATFKGRLLRLEISPCGTSQAARSPPPQLRRPPSSGPQGPPSRWLR